jgi:hypothetical protein
MHTISGMLLFPLLLLTSTWALIPVVAAYDGWPTVSGCGAYTALISDIDASPLTGNVV